FLWCGICCRTLRLARSPLFPKPGRGRLEGARARSQTVSPLVRRTRALAESGQRLPPALHALARRVLQHKDAQTETRAARRETRRLCQQERSRSPAITLVIVLRVNVELAKKFENASLLAPVNVFAQRFGHCRLLRLMAAELNRLLD